MQPPTAAAAAGGEERAPNAGARKRHAVCMLCSIFAVSVIKDTIIRNNYKQMDTLTKQLISDTPLDVSSVNFTVSHIKDTVCM